MVDDTDRGAATHRLTAGEIFQRVLDDARSEIQRPARSLAFSAVMAGLTMGLSGLSVAVVAALVGPGAGGDLVAALFYPVGFLAVIVGRGQLFTENTLYPVALVLDERRHLLGTARIWSLVLAGNLVGVTLFAALAAATGAVGPGVEGELVALGGEAAARPAADVFWSAVVGGWIIALVAWVVSASQWTVGQVVMIWFLTFLVGAGRFAHCIATSGEILVAAIDGAVSAGDFLAWLGLALAGNVVGGVGIVALLNYGQVTAERRR